MYLVGKIVGTHGIKGELKVKSDTSFNRFEKGNKLYIDKTQEIVINSHRQHKGMELITINNLNNINAYVSNVYENGQGIITSSPSFITARIARSIASLPPTVTIISSSGEYKVLKRLFIYADISRRRSISPAFAV